MCSRVASRLRSSPSDGEALVHDLGHRLAHEGEVLLLSLPAAPTDVELGLDLLGVERVGGAALGLVAAVALDRQQVGGVEHDRALPQLRRGEPHPHTDLRPAVADEVGRADLHALAAVELSNRAGCRSERGARVPPSRSELGRQHRRPELLAGAGPHGADDLLAAADLELVEERPTVEVVDDERCVVEPPIGDALQLVTAADPPPSCGDQRVLARPLRIDRRGDLLGRWCRRLGRLRSGSSPPGSR